MPTYQVNIAGSFVKCEMITMPMQSYIWLFYLISIYITANLITIYLYGDVIYIGGDALKQLR